MPKWRVSVATLAAVGLVGASVVAVWSWLRGAGSRVDTVAQPPDRAEPDGPERYRLVQLEEEAVTLRAAAAQARAELEVERQALQMFQRAMLPAELPRLGAVDLSAVYLPLAERVDIGGDWYDAFLLPDGRLALAVGDVTGHDLRAATVMGQVRNAVRAYATEHPDPGAVLARVNTLLARLPELDLVTMLYGVYDPVRHELVWSNAGHPPPLLRVRDTAQALTAEGGLLLGVVPDGEPYPEHRLRLDPGDSVLWYTDGIIDHRAIDPVEALERLRRAYATAHGSADELLGRVSSVMLADGQREDDVCLLALCRAPEPAGVPAAR